MIEPVSRESNAEVGGPQKKRQSDIFVDWIGLGLDSDWVTGFEIEDGLFIKLEELETKQKEKC